jgi:Type II secretion system protein B
MNFNSDQETQESQQTSSSDESPDMSGGDETAYLSSEKKPANTQMLALVGLLVVGAGVIGFMYLRNGPSAASGADAGTDNVKSFLANGEEHVQLMKQMLQNTDKVVQRFRTYPSQTQVPLANLQTNPFRLLPPKQVEKPANESEAAARRRLEEERQSAALAANSLRLTSIINGRVPTCMINGRAYKAGQKVEGFTIEQITPGAVVVRTGQFRFEVPLVQ